MHTSEPMSRQQAEAQARAMAVDRLVRLTARAGQADNAGYNYTARRNDHYGTLHVHATFGAGTRSASAHWIPASHPDFDQPLSGRPGPDDPTTVYRADDYGAHLVTFCYGERWIELLHTWAEEVAEGAAVETAVRQSAEEARLANRFRPLDG